MLYVEVDAPDGDGDPELSLDVRDGRLRARAPGGEVVHAEARPAPLRDEVAEAARSAADLAPPELVAEVRAFLRSLGPGRGGRLRGAYVVRLARRDNPARAADAYSVSKGLLPGPAVEEGEAVRAVLELEARAKFARYA